MKEAEIVRDQLVLPGLYGIGANDMGKWARMNRILLEQGIIKEGIDMERMIFVPAKGEGDWMGIPMGTISQVILLAIGIAATIYLNNQRLKRKVGERTHELRSTNQELERLNAFKDRMLALISHDIRGPLGRLTTLLDLYRSGNMSKEELDGLLDRIGPRLGALGLLLDNLLSWTGRSLDKGRIDIGPQNVDVVGLVQGVLDQFSDPIIKKDIDISLDIRVRELKCDAQIIRSVLGNLVANALRFSPLSGTVTISNHEEGNDLVVFTIGDQGEGLDSGTMGSLFASPVSSREGTLKEKGQGIGLYLCKELIGAHGGRIWARNKEEGGCRFHFSIPRTSA